jgi:epidermal growth factor receptor substrate 15
VESQLPIDKLGKIWDLADVDKDGALHEAEFTIAMHLVCKCLETGQIPDVLPQELQRLISLGAGAAPSKPPMPVSAPAPVPIQAPVQTTQTSARPIQKDNWVVPLEDRAKYRNLFEACDKDRDGFVSGAEIKGWFNCIGIFLVLFVVCNF